MWIVFGLGGDVYVIEEPNKSSPRKLILKAKQD
jgi:hypothetical protein